MKNPRRAVAIHRSGGNIFLTKEELEMLESRASRDLVYALDGGVLRIPAKEIKYDKIPTNSFGDDIARLFVYGKKSKAYGDFLQQEGVTEIRHGLDNCDKERAIVHGLWIEGLEFKMMGFTGFQYRFSENSVVFGVERAVLAQL